MCQKHTHYFDASTETAQGWSWGGFSPPPPPNLFGGLKHYCVLLLSKPGLSFTGKRSALNYFTVLNMQSYRPHRKRFFFLFVHFDPM